MLTILGEISVDSRVAEGSIFAFFIPVRVSSPPAQHEVNARAMQIHHSLNGERSAPLAIALDDPALVTDSMAGTSSRLLRTTSKLADTGNIHVLLVEDNEISQKLLKKQLVRAGCSVTTANDGVDAIDVVLENASCHNASPPGNQHVTIDVILMGEWICRQVERLLLIEPDIEMPRKGGLEATRDIRSMEAGGRLATRIPIIAVSANARSGQIESVSHCHLQQAMLSRPCRLLPP